ncbi:hypothetical protein IscW_ISCW021589 [Ixodes scapularis]|uniref:Uncharacterized protein n=1 Tax=Ixodes scapularis TaxID=6945 RepID=B7Q8N9_IXOSC|nr:hypothetical protein IscW_ISCW021589 [Ixodes scapularis]|eukprot:XP_002412391.1 hypothetical protein IscW_ISCW021589 [Ixodes scapularis]
MLQLVHVHLFAAKTLPRAYRNYPRITVPCGLRGHHGCLGISSEKAANTPFRSESNRSSRYNRKEQISSGKSAGTQHSSLRLCHAWLNQSRAEKHAGSRRIRCAQLAWSVKENSRRRQGP